MISREKRRTRNIVIGAVIIAVLTASSVAFLSYRIYNAKLIDERQKAQAQIAIDQTKLAAYEKKSLQGWVLVKDKAAGDKITDSDVQQKMLPDAYTPANVVTNKQDLVGKIIKINALASTTLTWEMIYATGPIQKSERREEAQYIKLPMKLQKEDTVDIRVVYPNGEDYIVIAKKKIDDIDIEKQIVFFNDNEEETLMLQSAMVDAYINNGQLYMKVYVDPEMQEAPMANYVANKDVQLLMQSNTDIVQTARMKLTNTLRSQLNDRLDNIAPEDWIRVGDAPPSSSASGGSGATQTVPSTTSGGVNDIVTNGNSTGNPAVLQPQQSQPSTTESSSIDSSTDKATIYPSSSAAEDIPNVTDTENSTSNETPNLLDGDK